jgi:hypothetical protein
VENENEHFVAAAITFHPISASVTPHLPTHILALRKPHSALLETSLHPSLAIPHETISKSQNGSTSLFTLPPRALEIQPALVLLLVLLNSHAIILIRSHIRTTNPTSTTASACTKAGWHDVTFSTGFQLGSWGGEEGADGRVDARFRSCGDLIWHRYIFSGPVGREHSILIGYWELAIVFEYINDMIERFSFE